MTAAASAMRQRRWLGAAIAAAGLTVAVFSLRVGLGAVFARPAQDYAVAAALSKQQLAEQSWLLAREHVALARRFQPQDPAFLELEGRLEDLGTGVAHATGAEIERRELAAVDAYRHAAELRPAWPYAWSGLALAKAAAGQFDAEFESAVNSALEHGPHEGRVVRDLARLRLIVPERLSPGLRTRLGRLFPGVFDEYPERWVDLADRHDQAEWLCALSGVPKSAQERCRKLGWNIRN